MKKDMVQSLVIVKPDGIELLPVILGKISENSINILSMKTLTISEEQARKVYEQQQGEYYFDALVKYLTMGPCFVLAIEGEVGHIAACKQEIRAHSAMQMKSKLASALIELVSSMNINDRVKMDFKSYLSAFSKEFLRTFDAIHCSDSDRGVRELNVFFVEEELLRVDFDVKKAVEIIQGKLSHQKPQVTFKGLIDENSHHRVLTVTNMGVKK